ncbi:MAG TPA: DNA repair protein RadC [Desulfotignum sp.]|nr:DNA repair protein RadC [Desulfotignum sp.]
MTLQSSQRMEQTRPEKEHKGTGHRKRLRERFLTGGLGGFHDYEVIELLLSLNTPRKDCKQTAKDLMKTFKNFQAVLEADVKDLCRVSGVGTANCLGIRLVKSVADRYLASKIQDRDVVNNLDDLKQYLHHTIGFKGKEHFAAVFLDAKNRVLASEILFSGSLTSSSVYPREVIIRALQHQSAAVIFAHNHPSGDVSPSTHDVDITRKLLFALGFVGITVHEHLIIGSRDVFSFAAQGLIDQYHKEFTKHNDI